MAGRGRGMTSNPGHSVGPEAAGMGQGGERRELRRPIVGQPGQTADDITRGMAKMEPYRDDFGNFGGYGGGGPNSGGQPAGRQAMGPPRPAPNADGWSSGENQYGQQPYQAQWNSGWTQPNLKGAHQQFQQPHNHFTSQEAQQNYAEQQRQQALEAQANQTASQGWSFNIGASEFVPKNSNLNVTAQEFVPRHMPQNTSYWAQQQQQQQQEMLYRQQQHNQVEVEQIPASAYHQDPNFDVSGMQPDYNQTPSNTQQSHSHHQGNV